VIVVPPVTTLLRPLWRIAWGWLALVHALLTVLCLTALRVHFVYRVPGTILPLVVPWIGTVLTVTEVSIFLRHFVLRPFGHLAERTLRTIEALAVVGAVMFVGYSAVLAVNGWWSPVPVKIHRSVVIRIVRAELDIGVIEPISWIELRSWRAGGRTETVLLRPGEDSRLWPGQEVFVRVRWGYLVIPWVMEIERDDAGYYRRIVEHVPTAARAWKELATEYLYADEWEKLPATVARYLALVPSDVAFAGGVAAAMGVVQRPVLVRAVLEPALAGPFNYRVFALAGMAYHLTGDSARGLELLERARQTDPANYLAYQGLGMVHENQGRLVEAVAMYEAALARNPNLPYVAAGLPKLRHRAGLPPIGAPSDRGSPSGPAGSSTRPAGAAREDSFRFQKKDP